MPYAAFLASHIAGMIEPSGSIHGCSASRLALGISWVAGSEIRSPSPGLMGRSKVSIHFEQTHIWARRSSSIMFGAAADFISKRQGDSAEFNRKAQALAIGVALGPRAWTDLPHQNR
jgi:hypothetical protein